MVMLVVVIMIVKVGNCKIRICQAYDFFVCASLKL